MFIRALLFLSLLLLSACGFHLRGDVGMPFATLYLESGGANSALVSELRRNLVSNKAVLVNQAEKADVVLQIVSEVADKQILTLSGAGRVNEFQLRYRVSLHAYDLKHNTWIPAEEMYLYRNFSYDDTKILAKESEEALLFQSMRNDMAQQILRRLGRAKAVPSTE